MLGGKARESGADADIRESCVCGARRVETVQALPSGVKGEK
jgi:hypothetical protein